MEIVNFIVCAPRAAQLKKIVIVILKKYMTANVPIFENLKKVLHHPTQMHVDG